MEASPATIKRMTPRAKARARYYRFALNAVRGIVFASPQDTRKDEANGDDKCGKREHTAFSSAYARSDLLGRNAFSPIVWRRLLRHKCNSSRRPLRTIPSWL